MSLAPIFTARFFKEHVEVSFGKDKEKVLAVNDFVKVVNNHVGLLTPSTAKEELGTMLQTSRGFAGMKMGEGKKKIDVFMYREEHRAPIMLDTRKLSVKEFFERVLGKKLEASGTAEMLARVNAKIDGPHIVFNNCLIPNFVCQVPLTLSADGKNYSIGKVLYGVTDSPREGLKLTNSTSSLRNLASIVTKRPMFPNFYDDGSMCYGSNQVLVTLANDGNFRPLEFYMTLITQSAFNFDILPRRFPSKFSGLQFALKAHGVTSRTELPTSVVDAVSANGLYTQFINYISYLTEDNAVFPYQDFKNEGD